MSPSNGNRCNNKARKPIISYSHVEICRDWVLTSRIKLIAIKEGLRLALHLELSAIAVLSGCLQVVSLLEEGEMNHSENAILMQEIRDLGKSFQRVEFHHIDIDGNMLANKLVKEAIRLRIFMLWNQVFPVWLTKLTTNNQSNFVTHVAFSSAW